MAQGWSTQWTALSHTHLPTTDTDTPSLPSPPLLTWSCSFSSSICCRANCCWRPYSSTPSCSLSDLWERRVSLYRGRGGKGERGEEGRGGEDRGGGSEDSNTTSGPLSESCEYSVTRSKPHHVPCHTESVPTHLKPTPAQLECKKYICTYVRTFSLRSTSSFSFCLVSWACKASCTLCISG